MVDPEQTQQPVAEAAASESIASVPAGARVVLVVSRGPSPSPPAVPIGMPDLLGAQQGKALARLQEVGLCAHVLHDHHERLPRGYVMGQFPSAGEGVQPGSDAVVVVSTGRSKLPAPEVALPSVVGLEHGLAVDRLTAAGLSSREVYEYDPVAAPGLVLAQIPSAASLARKVRKRAGAGWALSLLVLFAIAAIAGGVWFLNRPADVPNVVGMSQQQAEKAVRAAGFRIGSVVTSQTSSPSDIGKIVEQSPDPGITAPNGSAISLVVSGGQLLVSVPNVTGMTQGQAIQGLQTAGLLFTTSRAYSATAASGSVVAQAPAAGQRVPSGTTVGLTVSMGAQMVPVPTVVQQQSESALATLRSSGLVAKVVSNYETTTPVGRVILQSPSPGQLAAPGSAVGLVVSRGVAASGTPVATVPKGVGKTSAKAGKLLKRAKLKTLIVFRDGTGLPKGTVAQQIPDVGAIIPRNSWVILFVASGL